MGIRSISRAVLWACTWIFCAIILGLTGARIHFTRTFRGIDPVSGNTSHFYDPIIAELLVTAAMILLAAPVFVALAITSKTTIGWVSEMVFSFIVWVMFLVGAAIATHFWHGLGRCWSLRICKIITATLAFSWTAWAFITFIIALLLFGYKSIGRGTTGTTRTMETRTTERPVTTAAPVTTAPVA